MAFLASLSAALVKWASGPIVQRACGKGARTNRNCLQKALLAMLLVLPIGGAMARQSLPGAQAMPAVGGEVTLAGEFHVVWGDGPPGSGIFKYAYEITDDQGRSTRVILDEATLSPFGHPVRFNGKRVILRGKRVSQVSLVEGRVVEPTVQARSIQLVEEEVPRPKAAVVGSQPWVVIACRFSDSTGVTPRDTAYFTNLMGSSHPGLDHYWREVSPRLALPTSRTTPT
jgi:hypothetical protein